jgi:hypothetical protein
MKIAVLIITVAATALLQGCFYDSNWGQRKSTQRAIAARTTPQALQPTTDGTGDPKAPSNSRSMKVRVQVTPKYAAAHLDWQERFARTVAAANQVLAPTLNIQLQVGETNTWTPASSDDDLRKLLAELRTTDPANDADWVIGLAGPMARFETSIHQLGIADNPGKHIVVRAMNAAEEYRAVEAEFSELDEGERKKVYAARMDHKAGAVLLHEIAHSLGVIHETDPTSIMATLYSPKSVAFSTEATAVLRIAVEQPSERRGWVSSALVEAYRDQGSWVPADRTEFIARWEHQQAPEAPTPQTSVAVPTSTPAADPDPISQAGLEPLTEAHRALFEMAMREKQAGRPNDAWNTARPLFEAYPRVERVQDLRCQLGMDRNLSWQGARAECAGLMALTPGLHGKPKTK